MLEGKAEPAAATGRFHLPALLVSLSMGLPSLPLRPAAWKQEKRALRQAVTGRWCGHQEGSTAGSTGPHGVTFCHTCETALTFYLPFYQRSVPVKRMAEGVEGSGIGGSEPGQGKIRGVMNLEGGTPLVLTAWQRTQAGGSPASFQHHGWHHEGPWSEDTLQGPGCAAQEPLPVESTELHLLTRGGCVCS